MNAAQNYKMIVENIFQQPVDMPDTNDSNNCIGALNRSNNFIVFKNNFIERLKRIYRFFKADRETVQNLINTVRAIAFAKGYKWSGPYSELVALDFLIQYENLMNIRYVHKGDVNNFENSVAKKIGQKEIDLDISFDLHFIKIFMDVKSLIPTHLELVDNILEKLERKTTDKGFLIGIDDLFDVDYLQTKKDYIYELRAGTLIEELKKCIENKITFYEHTLQSGEKAKFRIAYAKPGSNTVLSTTRSMDPYRLAIDYKYKVLDYYNKLLTYKPSFILFVSNPWFNTEMRDFSGFNETFYRALSRRVFIELSKMKDDMGIYYPELKYKGLKICDICCLISGLIFIDDNSVLKTGKELYKAYIYTNPNAKNRYLRKNDFDILNWTPSAQQPAIIEDFIYDNY